MPSRVTELHSIMPIANIASILQHGILSHELVTGLPHADVSLANVQDKRKKSVPNGLRLHQYANLYFHARNPMMFLRHGQAESLCVLRVSNQVINLPGVVLTDQNAASDYVRFLPPSEQGKINFNWVYAEDWRDQNRITQWQKSSAKCAEVLVPNKVEPQYITGAYVVSEAAKVLLEAQGFAGPIEINTHLFFR